MVTWHDGAITNPAPAAPEAVRQAERALRIRFPADFLAVAAVHQGARPDPASFTLPDGSVEAIDHLLHFMEGGLSSVTERILPLRGVLPKGVIPFANALGSNVLCFNYRGDYDNPTVKFWSVDTGSLPIASDFTDLLGKLHE